MLIDCKQITFGGNHKLKIFGTLNCSSGRRMKIANRVFFKNEQEASSAGYRPCGHCMRAAYQKWKLLNADS
ncbi:Ada metal-binding domain-containing protein [Mucilaginibacter conchicola]|nr:Ada metal-binding domain-containing protein [Mucilaginibacter conchicola]